MNVITFKDKFTGAFTPRHKSNNFMPKRIYKRPGEDKEGFIAIWTMDSIHVSVMITQVQVDGKPTYNVFVGRFGELFGSKIEELPFMGKYAKTFDSDKKAIKYAHKLFDDPDFLKNFVIDMPEDNMLLDSGRYCKLLIGVHIEKKDFIQAKQAAKVKEAQ